MTRWMIEYFAPGARFAADCDPDFYPSREAAERHAPLALPDWADSWRVHPTTSDDDDKA